MVKEFYKILEISENANQEEIKKTYRKLALKWHPDKWSSKSETEIKKAEEKFKEIAEAYFVLSNPEKRSRYDKNPEGYNGSWNNSFEEWEEYYKGEKIRLREEMIRRREIFIDRVVDELDPSLWIPYSDWKEKVRSFANNETNELIKFFKKLGEATERIEKARAKKQEEAWTNEKEEIDKRANLRKKVANEIIDEMYVNSLSFDQLDPKIWEPYKKWSEKLAEMPITIIGEESKELTQFKEEMFKAIKETEAKKQFEKKDKERKQGAGTDAKIEKEKKYHIEEIENLMTEKGLKAQDLGEYSNYKEKINKLDKIWKIRSFAEEITNYIWNELINKKMGEENRKGDKTDNDLKDQNNNKIDYKTLTREELIKTVNQKDLENSSLKEIILALEKKIEDLEEEIRELKTEKSQTPQIQQEIRKRENYLQEIRNSLEKVNNLNNKKPTGDNNKSSNNFPTGLIVGGGILVVVGLMAILIVRKSKKKNPIRAN